MNQHTALILLAAGTASIAHAADEQPRDELPQTAQGRLIAPSQIGPIKHVFYHIGTGETIISSVKQGQTVGTDTGSSELIWSVDLLTHQCEGINDYNGISAVGLGDDIDGTDPWDIGGTWHSEGDIATDTVVDCVRFNYFTTHEDVDLDNDGNGDGIPGFGIVLDWWGADNGFGANWCARVPLIQLTFSNLEGAMDLAPGLYAGFQFTVDLTSANNGESLVMEIGDTDGDLQGAAVHNPQTGLSYPDMDGDGLFDWARQMRFIQPGSYDFDGDGILDGDVADQADTAIGMGNPAGYTLTRNGDGSWDWVADPDHPAIATGFKPYTRILLPPDPITGKIVDSGFLSTFAGFTDGVPNTPSCDDGEYRPAAIIAHALYSPRGSGCDNPADLNADGMINFHDIAAFLDDFATGRDFNDDGYTDFFDVSDFLDAFAAGGCN